MEKTGRSSLGAVTMFRSRSPSPMSEPTPESNAVEVSPLPRRPSSAPGGFDIPGDLLPPIEAYPGDSNSPMAEDAREGPPPPGATPEGEADSAQQKGTTPSTNINVDTSIMVQLDHDDSPTSLRLPPLTDRDDNSSLLHASSEDGDPTDRYQNQTFIEEKEMRRKLMDMESSFLPEPSTIQVPAGDQNAGVHDTYLVRVSGEKAGQSSAQADNNNNNDDTQTSFVSPDATRDNAAAEDPEQVSQALRAERGEESAIDLDATPAVSVEQSQGNNNITLLEIATSSPAAAAAARTAQRNSSASLNDPSASSQIRQEQKSPSQDPRDSTLPPVPQTVRKSSRNLSPFSQDSTGTDRDATGTIIDRRATRPKYLTTRSSSHRLSSSSVTSSNTETTNSEATLGADYALQSGGAAPGHHGSSQPRRHNDLARSVSLGSLASGISGYSDENVLEKRNLPGPVDGGLQTLTEEEAQSRPGTSQHKPTVDDSTPMTPKEKPPQNSNMLTDTVIADRVKDIQIPSSFVRQYREDFGDRGMSPSKRTGAPAPGFTRSGRTMTLKEQSSTIDRLSKENFDLKMRIHFLNEALNKRSEEGVKEVVSENVELKSDKLKLQKENQNLKRRVRDLEKQLKDQESDKESMINHDPEASEDEERDLGQQEEEILFLRERLDVYELEIERLRSESIARETEKRRLAEVVKSLSEGRAMGSDVGAREERVS